MMCLIIVVEFFLVLRFICFIGFVIGLNMVKREKVEEDVIRIKFFF